MITLYSFGPGFGLPDPSPFVTKAEVLLKMAELPYRTDTTGFKKAPKGKLPYIDDEGKMIADSTFIRWDRSRPGLTRLPFPSLRARYVPCLTRRYALPRNATRL